MTDVDPIANLIPSLVQSFGVIIMGYAAVRLSLISSQSQALGQYVTTFALPAVFFRSMATIDLFNVNWMFILAVSLVKFIFFILTVAITILITRPVNLGMAGILSMFITQSNDVALGYPILNSLFPPLVEYIYLFAPAQLVFINPLCFMLLEIHEYRISSLNRSVENRVSATQRGLLVLKKVAFNPLVYMTLFGIIFNFILSHKLPLILDKLLQILAESFSGVALFYLGVNMVGKLGNLNVRMCYILFLLLLGKLIIMPFLTREAVVHLVGNSIGINETLNYSLMGFFYGGLPTAPPVFLISNNFQILTDVIATGLVLGTFLSGPLMFITGQMVTMLIASPSQYDDILQNTAISVSTISIFGSIWVIFVFVISKKCKKPLFRVTIFYLIFVLLSCLGLTIGRIFLTNSMDKPKSTPTWGHYVQFSVFFIGVTGTRIWTALMSMTMYIINRYGVEYFQKYMFVICLSGTCLPVIITSILLIFFKKSNIKDIDPSFQYGRDQIITSITVLIISVLVSTGFLLMYYRSNAPGSNILSGCTDSSERLINMNESNENDILTSINNNDDDSNDVNSVHRTKPVVEVASSPDSEDTNMNFDVERTDSNPDNEHEIDHSLMNKHILLIIILLVTMMFGIFLCLWRLIQEEVSGIYIELEFLDCSFNFGQGFIVWALFGFDVKVILRPFRRLANWWQNIKEFYIPPEGHLDRKVKTIRNKFALLYMTKCKTDINRNVRIKMKQYQNVFSGASLIDWIVSEGLESDRLSAHAYGQSLLIGKLLESVKGNRNLIDSSNQYYRFIECENITNVNINDNNTATHDF